MLNVLKYLHDLESFKTHKPIIFTSSNDLYQNYYDYWPIDNGLFILCAKSAHMIGKAYYALDLIRSNSIIGVFNPANKDVDASKIPGGDTSNISDAKIKSILEDLSSGKDNENISFDGAIVTMDNGETVYITDKCKFGSSVFSVEEATLDNALMVGNPGKPIVENKSIIIPYKSVNTISIPLQYVNYSPFKSMINNDIKKCVDQYLKNIYSGFTVEPYREFKVYNKGERIIFRYKEENKDGSLSDFKYKNYISKIANNDTMPMSKACKERDAWLEYSE